MAAQQAFEKWKRKERLLVGDEEEAEWLLALLWDAWNMVFEAWFIAVRDGVWCRP